MLRLRDIVFDCARPAATARFWAAALEGHSVAPYDDAELARLRALGITDPDDDPTVLVESANCRTSAAPAPEQPPHTPETPGLPGRRHLHGSGKSGHMPSRPRQGSVRAANRSVTSRASRARLVGPVRRAIYAVEAPSHGIRRTSVSRILARASMRSLSSATRWAPTS
ncbi:VOC family protein [Streptomyces sp. NPDC001401]|uniref:VOC family protein n=1 Tax=Streptomyces sp. NPDC001401 TaxID=3364570 RepID=UPI00367DA5D7